MPISKPPVFLSYSHKDRKKVNQLIQALNAEGVDHWSDQGIEGGHSWRERIISALESASLVVPIISPNYTKRQWPMFELGFTARRVREFQARLVPVLLRGTSVPDPISESQYLDARVLSLRQVAQKIRKLWEEWERSPISGFDQLPSDIPDFTGRQEEIARVKSALDGSEREGETSVAIAAISGMAGVGKSALAIHVAHQVKSHFPDARLYVNLLGAQGVALDPIDALAGFLRDFVVRGSPMPEDLQGRARRYRAWLAGKRALVVLDNAHDEAQVRHLLPGSPSCAVLVTSRSPLLALEGAALLNLNVMTEDEALNLLGNLIKPRSVREELDGAKRIIEFCGCLPLALRIVGSKLKDRPDCSIADYAKQLADEYRRLEGLGLADLDVRASFTLSYENLDPTDSRIFRRLGLLTGTDFARDIAPALVEEQDVDSGRDAMERLAHVRLLESAGKGRYRLHDLLRIFARERLTEEETPEAQDAMRLRVARWYLEQSGTMDAHLRPETRYQKALAKAAETDQPLREVVRALIKEALAWFENERTNLLTAMDWGYQAGQWSLLWQLAKNLVNFFEMHALWTDWERTQQLALEATRRAFDPKAEAEALINLGKAHRMLRSWDEAIRTFEQALRISREIGDGKTEAKAINNIGIVHFQKGSSQEAGERFEVALRMFRGIADQHGESQVLMNLGSLCFTRGQFDEGLRRYDEALTISREREDLYLEGNVLYGRGATLLQKGDLDEACEAHEEALRIFRELGHRYNEAQAMYGVAYAYAQQKRFAESVLSYEGAMQIFRELGDPYLESAAAHNLAEVHRLQNHLDVALRWFEISKDIGREIGESQLEGLGLKDMGVVCWDLGEKERALVLWRQALTKLQPDSPGYREVETRLQSTDGDPGAGGRNKDGSGQDDA